MWLPQADMTINSNKKHTPLAHDIFFHPSVSSLCLSKIDSPYQEKTLWEISACSKLDQSLSSPIFPYSSINYFAGSVYFYSFQGRVFFHQPRVLEQLNFTTKGFIVKTLKGINSFGVDSSFHYPCPPISFNTVYFKD